MFVSFMPQVMAAALLALVCGVLYAMEVQCSEGSYILVEVSSSDSEVLAGAGQALDCSGEDDVELVVVTPVCSATCSSSVVMASLTSPHLVWDGNSSLLGVVSMSGGQVLGSLFSRVGVPVVVASPIARASAGVFHMLSSSIVLVDAIMQLSAGVEWSRIGLVTDSFQPYLVATTAHFFTLSPVYNITLSPYIELGARNAQYAVDLVKTHAAKVVVLSLSGVQALDVLSVARSQDMVWPEYVWIVHSITNEQLNSSIHMEGLVFVNQKVWEGDMGHCGSTLSSNTYAGLLFDSVYAIILSQAAKEEGIAGTVFAGVSGNISFNSLGEVERNVLITQVRNGSEVLLGVYANKTLSFGGKVDMEFPRNELRYVYPATVPVWLAAIEIGVCIVFVTTVLGLYLYFRKEAEIKATSISLSLIIFLGCYMMILYLIFLTFQAQLAEYFNVCVALIWLSSLGLSVPLIFATLLVKMLRVYHIFNHFQKLGRISSDFSMLFFILLVLTPHILVLILFTFSDSYRWEVQTTLKVGYIVVFSDCTGNISPYYTALCVWLLVMILAISVVAFKTRKVRIKHFRDAKNVNGLLFMLVLLGTIGLILYRLLDDHRYRLEAELTVYVGTMTIIVLCQAFLFVPKLLPLLYNKTKCCSCHDIVLS